MCIANATVVCALSIPSQVHIVLSEVASDQVKCDIPSDEESEDDSDDTNLSDTDPEDEWDTPIPARV